MKSEIRGIVKKNKFLFAMKFLISIILRGSLLIIPFFYSYAVEAITNGNLNQACLLVLFLFIVTAIYYLSEMVNDYSYEKLYAKI